MKRSTCEAQRRDGSRCPYGWKHALHTGVSRYHPDHLPHPNLRTVYLCGQHRNALGKGIMTVPLVAPEGKTSFIAEYGDGTFSLWEGSGDE